MGEGPAVLLLHGFPDTPHTFGHQLPALAAAGYRAVAVTSRGHEPSSIPAEGSYRLRDLAQDVLDWLQALGEPRAHFIGHDWGATIGFAAMALQPAAFRSFTAIAVPTPRRFGEELRADTAQLQRSGYILFFQQEGVAERAVAADDWAYLERLWREGSPGWEPGPGALAALRRQFARPGVLPATLSYYRQALDTATPAAQAGAALLAVPTPVPTLGIHGARDGCIGADVFERSMRAADFAAGLALLRVEGTGHFVYQEQPDAVNERVIAFLVRTRGEASRRDLRRALGTGSRGQPATRRRHRRADQRDRRTRPEGRRRSTPGSPSRWSFPLGAARCIDREAPNFAPVLRSSSSSNSLVRSDLATSRHGVAVMALSSAQSRFRLGL
ncbi:MAG: alpha/beta fold hydrolase [Pseudomonadota bacterium]|jgi:pimeloyl-ACP methyl ester carboxylesterase|nr:alpha/beta hydrolase [Rubrivivax sp.]MCZ8032767.1 alpha/beta hydrolase [Rubrivivax sp.]